MVTSFLAYFGFWSFIFISGIIFGYIQALETRNKIDAQLRRYRE
jgi:hypothetical protein